MPKEKNYNPVAAQRKADKAKAIKKGKSETQERRNERLARKNPDQVQRQIDELKKITDGGGKLSRHEEQVLEGLEKELKAVRKAREALGDKAPTFGRGRPPRDGDGGGGDGVLGKRRRAGGGGDMSSDEEEVPEEVRRIPMPRDTPPPIPKEVLDAWYAKRRAQRAHLRPAGGEAAAAAAADKVDKVEEKKPAQTVYSAAPVTRDLQKEAVAAFVPSAVRSKLAKGAGGHAAGLLEPEEADALESQGYMATGESSRKVTVEDAVEEEEE